MKSGHCPHCTKKIALTTLKNLRKNRAIYCPSCTKPIRANQKTQVLTIGIFSGLFGILGRALFDLTFVDIVILVVTFSVCYTFIHLNYIGIYFPLEKADDEDLIV